MRLRLGMRAGEGKRTCSNDVVHHQHLLSRLHAVGLHLEEIAAVFLLVRRRLAGSGQLALLADRHEASSEPQCQAGTEQEAAGV